MSTAVNRAPAEHDAGNGWLWVERVAWTLGIAALGLSLSVGLSGTWLARRALEQFAALAGTALIAVGVIPTVRRRLV
jgi:hypothetical protein